MQLILAANLISSFLLCGLIWTVQLVHYPMFHKLSRKNFSKHIQFHGFRISLIVVPLMVIELLSSFSLAFFSPSDTVLHATGFFIVLLIWLTTFFIQVPLHSKLTMGYNPETVNKLVKTNFIRSVLWSIKATVGAYILFL
ncbi:MAG: hypothetical protein EA391_08960 [Balneolaceae bacterium]|nr:MAG: hypothetical protein EA391_08960 [Balneolaceae bacterium]